MKKFFKFFVMAALFCAPVMAFADNISETENEIAENEKVSKLYDMKIDVCNAEITVIKLKQKLEPSSAALAAAMEEKKLELITLKNNKKTVDEAIKTGKARVKAYKASVKASEKANKAAEKAAQAARSAEKAAEKAASVK